MPSIQISAPLMDFIKAKAEPWVDKSVEDTIGRLIGFAPSRRISEAEAGAPQAGRAAPEAPRRKIRRKKPKADLGQLLEHGDLELGEKLHLIDYQNTRVPAAEAVLTDRGLRWEGSEYSMSKLAALLLKRAGYSANSVRGPAHWRTSEGVTVMELWERFSANGQA